MNLEMTQFVWLTAPLAIQPGCFVRPMRAAPALCPTFQILKLRQRGSSPRSSCRRPQARPEPPRASCLAALHTPPSGLFLASRPFLRLSSHPPTFGSRSHSEKSFLMPELLSETYSDFPTYLPHLATVTFLPLSTSNSWALGAGTVSSSLVSPQGSILDT